MGPGIGRGERLSRSLARLLVLLATICSGLAAEISERQFTPGQYQTADGALVMGTDGNFVEPYFATKALIVGQDAGLDVRQPALSWIAWFLPRQIHDGRPYRYCRKEKWKRCGRADADDSLLALWLQLLYRMAPDAGMPAEWKQSVQRSEAQLERLWDRKTGVYHISRENHASLFMDNVEVYSALKDVAQQKLRLGDRMGAQAMQARADRLAGGMKTIFWDKKYNYFRVSNQKESRRTQFYPDAVAQTFALQVDLTIPNRDPQMEWKEWKAEFGSDWLGQRRDPHPWGLLAITAEKMGDSNTAACWVERSEHLRYSDNWNILEEAAYQAIKAKVGDAALDARACTEVVAWR